MTGPRGQPQGAAAGPPLLIAGLLPDAGSAALAGKERDTLRLTWEERRWTRRRLVTSRGRAVALALPTGTTLRPGDVLAVDETWYLAVEPSPEPVLAVFPRDRAEGMRVAFEVGNRHLALAVHGPVLLVPDDPAAAGLLDRLGARWERRQAVFDPSVGAAGAGEARPGDLPWSEAALPGPPRG
ncbi:MAG TPA: urease accessory protein UreE [Candidatus Binatia bacterium]|nr:urease accessory protein UreE [Candidatus Binatia bacterium]